MPTGEVFTFFIDLFDHGCKVVEVARVLLPLITVASRTTPYIYELCQFLTRVAKTHEGRRMLWDDRLWMNLSERFSESTATPILELASSLGHDEYLWPIAQRAIAFVIMTQAVRSNSRDVVW